MNRDRDTERHKQKLITMGKQKGYVTYDEVNDAMPDEIVSSDQIDDWLSTLGDEGIEVVDGGGAGGGVKVPTARAAPKVPEVAAVIEARERRGVAESEEKESEKEESKRTTRATRRPTTRCACTCARWARSRCSRAKARSRSPSASRRASAACCRSCSTSSIAVEEILELGNKLKQAARSASRKSSATSTRKTPSSTRSGTPIASCKLIDKVRRLHAQERGCATSSSRGKVPETKKKKLKDEIEENKQEMFEQLSELRINKKQIEKIVQKLKELVVRIEKARERDQRSRAQDRPVAEGSAQDAARR